MRGTPPSRAALAVALLVVVSTAVRFAAARSFAVPWIAPDEMLYGLLGESLWSTGALEVRGSASPFYSFLTPALVGLALTGRALSEGVELAQLLQGFAMSTAAVPVYLWARRVATARWSVAAAAVTLASPVLAYGGLLVTEALFYPASAWALYALSRALEQPTVARQGLFLLAVTVAAAVRLQALVLLPAFVLAACAFALQRRRLTPVLPLVPLVVGVGVVVVALAAVRLAYPGSLASTDLLGAYATLGESVTVTEGLVPMLVWHVGAVVLSVAIVPAMATALLVVESFRGRGLGTAAEACAATAVGYLPLLAAQVGLFASGRVDHVSQRYLVSAIPLLAVGFAGWVGAGAPRTRTTVVAVGAATLGLVALVPPARLAPGAAMHDALSTAGLHRLDGEELTGRLVLLGATVAAIALVALVPARRLGALAAVVVAALALASVEATRLVERLSAAEEASMTGGSDARWLDRAQVGDVTLLVTGDRPWTADARTVFWNRSVTEVLRFPDVPGGVPPAPAPVSLDADTGLLRDSRGRPLARGLLVAPATLAFAGERIAELPAGSAEVPSLVVWRTSGPVRVASRVFGLQPNGDFSGVATVLVPACVPGALEVTVIAKSGDPIAARVNEQVLDPIEAAPGETPTVSLRAPGYVDGSRPCLYELRTDGYAGTTRIAYVPDA